jgi:single-strand selective monofunctional uracil DNA glycosylase
VEELIRISRALAAEVDALEFRPPVAHIYNPLVYAGEPHETYLARYGRAPKEVVLVGMNPGPFGMAQTGVPFGDVAMVRDFLRVGGAVGRPAGEHPKRPIRGFSCPRGEVSGTRLWGWVARRFGAPEPFFERFFVVNYCPLVFLEASGRNRTPDKLAPEERDRLFAICDRALADTIAALGPRIVVGIGAFAEARCMEALAGTGVRVGRMLHPSPASPAANAGWERQAEGALRGLGIELRGRLAPHGFRQ